jgi:oligoendopeptidase F
MFSGAGDPLVQKATDDVVRMAQGFALRYQGKIRELSTEKLLECLKRFEEYYAKLDSLSSFSGLSYVANMTLPDTQSLNDRVNKIKTKLGKMLAFLNIELGSLVSKNPEIINDPTLVNYRHFLEKLKREIPHQLSEAEEKLVIEKDQFGIRAWEELQGKWLNTRTFDVMVEGKKRTLSFGEAYGLTYHPDRPTRESATKSIYSLLSRDGEIYSSALRNICNDWLNVCGTRKYASPMEASLIANDIDQETISNLLKTVQNNTELYQRYLRLKAKIMKLPKLSMATTSWLQSLTHPTPSMIMRPQKT